MCPADLPGEEKTIAVGEHHVEDEEVRRAGVDGLPDARDGAELHDLVIGEAQVRHHGLAQGLVVLDKKDPRHLAPSSQSMSPRPAVGQARAVG